MDVIEVQRWAYVQDLPSDIDPVRHLLRTYSRIPEEHVDSHLRRVVSPAGRRHVVDTAVADQSSPLRTYDSERTPGMLPTAPFWAAGSSSACTIVETPAISKSSSG